jgi:predicted Rossmann fold flavoprotein
MRVIVVGGGAAGFFAAITCAEAAPENEVTILEKGPQFLSKVRISGGGRCNVTYACFDSHALTICYPRGEKALIGPYQQFNAQHTVEWFERRGVKLKVEEDGRMFPITDLSETVIDCLIDSARKAGVKMFTRRGVQEISKGFRVLDSTREQWRCDRVLLATGGCRTPALGALATSLGHTLEPPVPSLFTFHVDMPWVKELAGVSVPQVVASVKGTTLGERGALLFTHWGLSGPAILRLSAWGARELHASDYRFVIQLNWLPELSDEAIRSELQERILREAARLVVNSPMAPLPARLWRVLVVASGIPEEQRWSSLGKRAQHQLVEQLRRTELPVSGKSLNKDEFVTCGGVRLSEVNFKTMESRICPGLYFAGELLDIDGITGGFNFQAAWTTGWLAGRAMAGKHANTDGKDS